MLESCTVPDRQVNAALIPGVVVLIARRLLPLSISVVPCLTRVANLTCHHQEWNWCTRFIDTLFPISCFVFPSVPISLVSNRQKILLFVLIFVRYLTAS
jgi:hypothetical protein